MLSRPQLRLLSVLALLFAIAQATWFDAYIFNHRRLDARQAPGISDNASGPGGTGSPATSTNDGETTPPPAQSPTPTPTPTPTPRSSPTPAPPSTTPSNRPPATPTPPGATPPSTSAVLTPSSTAPPEQTPSTSTTSETTTNTTPKVTPTPTTFVVVSTIVRTQDGSTISSVASSTVTSTLPTATPALNGDGSPKSSSGMSTKTRNTIIGVAVGIGGAIVLAGLGVVVFRIWGRKRNAEDNDGLMTFGTLGHEKQGSASAPGATGASPFTSTLESYHNPARNGNVNASSNF